MTFSKNFQEERSSMEKWVTIININLITALMFLITFFLNRASNSGIFFGVRFPLEYLRENELLKIEKVYKKLVIIAFAVIFLVSDLYLFFHSFAGEDELSTFMSIFIVILLVFMEALYLPFYFKVKKLKKEKGWTYKKSNIVITDTTLRKPKKSEKYKPLNSSWFLLLLIPWFVTVGITIYKGLNMGKQVYQYPVVQLIMVILFYLLSRIINSSKVDLNSGNIEKAVLRKKIFRRYGSIFMLVIGFESILTFSISQFSLIFNVEVSNISNVLIILIALTCIVFIGTFIMIGQGGRNLSLKDKDEEVDELYRDDDDKWILGGLYCNKNDPAWMVEKRRGIGWTINVANPKSWIFIIVLVVFIVISAIFNK